MKLGKSKLALAKVINENGGWPQDSEWAVQNGDHGRISFSINKPVRHDSKSWMAKGGFNFKIEVCKPLKNWHQCVLNREEYYQAYPMTDDDGWVEWNGGECPVERGTLVDVKYSGGEESFGVSALTEGWHDDHVRGSNGKRTAVNWVDTLPVSGIIAYRLHKPEVKPEFCESVTHGIPEPESIDGLCAKVTEENKHQHVDAKPTIEQLAQDYRNKLDFAKRKQQEADDAKAAADAALGELERAGEELWLLIAIAKPDQEPELVIADWRDLKAGDVVEITGSSNNCWKDHSGREMTVKDVYPEHGDNDDQVYLIGESGAWCLGGNTTWRFIRRP